MTRFIWRHSWLTSATCMRVHMHYSVYVSNKYVFLFSLLPDTLLHCLSCIHLLALHRQLLADTLLMDRPTMQNAGNTHLQCLLSKLQIFMVLRKNQK